MAPLNSTSRKHAQPSTVREGFSRKAVRSGEEEMSQNIFSPTQPRSLDDGREASCVAMKNRLQLGVPQAF